MVDSDPIPKRGFSISEKTSHTWIAANALASWEARIKIAGDMVINAMELEPGVQWKEILDEHVIAQPSAGRRFGTAAIAYSHSQTVGSVAVAMEWDMHAPVMVVMSSLLPLSYLKLDFAKLSRKIEEGEAGERRFGSEEELQEALRSERAKTGRLGAYISRLRGTLGEYRLQNDLENPLWESILSGLLWMGHPKYRINRANVFQSIKDGDLETADRLLAASRK